MNTTNTLCDSKKRKLPRVKIVGDEDLPRIHEASIDLLENAGVILVETERQPAGHDQHGAEQCEALARREQRCL